MHECRRETALVKHVPQLSCARAILHIKRHRTRVKHLLATCACGCTAQAARPRNALHPEANALRDYAYACVRARARALNRTYAPNYRRRPTSNDACWRPISDRRRPTTGRGGTPHEFLGIGRSSPAPSKWSVLLARSRVPHTQ